MHPHHHIIIPLSGHCFTSFDLMHVHHLSPPLVPCTCTTSFGPMHVSAPTFTSFRPMHVSAPPFTSCGPTHVHHHHLPSQVCFTSFATTHMHGHLFSSQASVSLPSPSGPQCCALQCRAKWTACHRLWQLALRANSGLR